MSEVQGSAVPQAVQPTPEMPAIVKEKVKVNGQEREVTMDDLRKDYELRSASHERMQKAAELEKRTNLLIKDLESNPWKVFELLKKDPDAEAEARLIKKLEHQMMTPEQKKLWQREQELEKRSKEVESFENQKKQFQEQLALKEQEELNLKAVQDLDREIADVLRATRMNPTPKVIGRMAEIMLSHLGQSQDGKRLDAKEAYSLFDRELGEDLTDLLASQPIDVIYPKLPKKFLDGIRKLELEKISSVDPVRRKSEVPSNSSKAVKGKKHYSTDDLFEALERKIK